MLWLYAAKYEKWFTPTAESQSKFKLLGGGKDGQTYSSQQHGILDGQSSNFHSQQDSLRLPLVNVKLERDEVDCPTFLNSTTQLKSILKKSSGLSLGYHQSPKTVTFLCKEVQVQTDKTSLTPVLPFRIHGRNVQACIDTGAQVTLMSEGFYNSLPNKPKLTQQRINLRMAGDQLMYGYMVRNLEISIAGKVYLWNVYVTKIHDDFLLGIDFMHRYGAILNLRECTFSIGDETHVIEMVKDEDGGKPYGVSRVWIKRKCVVPPKSVVHITASTHLTTVDTDFAISPSNNIKGLLMPNMLVKGKPEVMVRVINDTDKYVYLRKGHILGFAVEVADIPEYMDDNSHVPKAPEIVRQVKGNSKTGVSKMVIFQNIYRICSSVHAGIWKVRSKKSNLKIF